MKTVIGIVGPIASGKDTVAEHISKKLGMPVLQISQPLKEIAKERNIPLSRRNLIQISRELAAKEGEDILARMLLDSIKGKGIITGMRQPAQIKYLRQNSKFVLISVDADVRKRFGRLASRDHLDEGKTFEDFVANEKEEDSSNNVQRLSDCMKMADYRLENNADVNALYAKVDELLIKMAIDDGI